MALKVQLMRYLLLLMTSISVLALSAQSTINTYNSAKDSDKKSIAILNKLKAIYTNTTKQVTSSFNLNMNLPGNKTQLEKGSIIQLGNKFKLDAKSISVINDAKTVWIINKTNKEIQIHDNISGSASGPFNPTDIIRMYDQNKFISVCTFDGVKNGIGIQTVELKPVDKKTTYSKARITTLKSNGNLSRIELFNKDGSRYDLTILKTSFSKANSNIFTFSKTSWSGYNVEDLRVN